MKGFSSASAPWPLKFTLRVSRTMKVGHTTSTQASRLSRCSFSARRQKTWDSWAGIIIPGMVRSVCFVFVPVPPDPLAPQGWHEGRFGWTVCTQWVCIAAEGSQSFHKGAPSFSLGGRHVLYNPGQQTNLLSALLHLSSNAASCTNILVTIVGNKSWYQVCRNMGDTWRIVFQ